MSDNELENIYDYLDDHKAEGAIDVEKMANDLGADVNDLILLLAYLHSSGLTKLFVRIKKVNEYDWPDPEGVRKEVEKNKIQETNNRD